MASQVPAASRFLNKADTRSRSRSRAWIAPLITVLLFMALDLRVLALHNWEPRAFVLDTPANISPDQGWGVGYDGRFAYHMAVNPWGSTAGLDAPTYRYQRIVYPVLLKVFSFGRAEAVPWVMLGINLFAAGLGTYALAILLERRSVAPLLALVFPLSIGFLFSMRTNLLEPLALAIGLVGWLAYDLDQKPGALVLFAIGGLTKEIALIFPAALVFWELYERRWRVSLQILVAAFLPYAAWYLVLWTYFGPSAQAIEKSRLMLIPFSGLQFLTDPPSLALILIWVVVPAAIASLSAGLVLWRLSGNVGGKEAMLVLVSAGLIAILPQMTWVDPLAIIRFGLGFLAALLLWLAAAYPRALPYVAAIWAPSGLILALVPGML